MKNQKFKKGLVALAAVATLGTGAALYVPEAQAQTVPLQTCTGITTVAGYAYLAGGTSSLADYSFSLCMSNNINTFYNQTMTWLQRIYTYMTNGTGDTGKGIIGTMTSLQKQMRLSNEEIANNAIQHQQRMGVEAGMAKKLMDAHPDPRACVDLPRFRATSIGGGGGGGRAAKGNEEARFQRESVKTSDLEHAVATYNGRTTKGYCDPSDTAALSSGGNRRAYACTGVGTLPNADARVQSLFVPAHNYTDASSARNVNLTFNNGAATAPAANRDQRQAAQDAIVNIAGRFSPPALDQRTEDSPNGKLFLAKWKVYEGRVSAAVNVLTSLSSSRTAGEGNLTRQQTEQVWGNARPTYTRIYGGSVPFPTNPSEAEVIKYEVLSRYLDRESGEGWDQKLKNGTGEEASKEVARTLAVTNYLLFQIHQRLEEGNAVSAVNVLNQINPMTKEEVERAAKVAAGSNK